MVQTTRMMMELYSWDNLYDTLYKRIVSAKFSVISFHRRIELINRTIWKIKQNLQWWVLKKPNILEINSVYYKRNFSWISMQSMTIFYRIPEIPESNIFRPFSCLALIEPFIQALLHWFSRPESKSIVSSFNHHLRVHPLWDLIIESHPQNRIYYLEESFCHLLAFLLQCWSLKTA